MAEVLIEKVTGRIDKILYQAKDNPFVIAKASINDKDISERFFKDFKKFKGSDGQYHDVSIKGNLGMVLVDKNMSFTGKIGRDHKYGPYLAVDSFEMLDKQESILVSAIRQGYIKGISSKVLDGILEKYPDSIEDVFRNRPYELLTIQGIGKKNLSKIIESYENFWNNEQLNTLCVEYGLSGRMRDKIVNTWKNNISEAIKEIRENPYILAEKVTGIGFRTADKIALRHGIDKNDPRRVYASFVYVVNEKIATEGHCYIPYNILLLQSAYELAGVNDIKKLPQEIISIVQKEGERIKKESNRDKGKNFLYTEEYIDPKSGKEKYRVWNNALRFSENSSSSRLVNLIQSKQEDVDLQDLFKAITRSEFDRKIKLDPLQRDAIISSFCNNVSITTGGPGTGKTTILKIFLDLLMKYKHIDAKDIALVAPTGKAAKRMTEAVDMDGLSASTIHRLLGSNGFTSMFNEDNKLPQKVFIVDEFSMVTIDLFSDLLKALPDDAKLLMIGDIDQLPSVGAGNVLKDMIESEVLPVNRLERIFRQSERSWISQNAYHVKNGEIDKFNFGIDSEDFFFTEFRSIGDLDFDEKEAEYKACQDRIIEQIDGILTRTNPKTGKLYTLDDIMLMLPMKKGELGVNRFNELLQKHFNKDGEVIPWLKGKFRVGDKVMQTKNNYEIGVFNGEQGVIESYNKNTKSIRVNFFDKKVVLHQENINELDLSYAITIHKSQGSEAPITILCLTNSHYIMLQRNLLYTGITRTKNECHLFGEKNAIITAIKNKKIQERNTQLKDKLIEATEKLKEKEEYVFTATEEDNSFSPTF